MSDVPSDGVDVSKVTFEIAYDGPALADHSMDVRDLAPAMLGLGELIKQINQHANGEKSRVKLRVSGDFEHKCFNITFEVIQSIFEQIKMLVGDDDIKSAKELLEWIGIVGGASVVPLLTFLRLRRGRAVQNIEELRDEDSRGSVRVQFHGDGNTVVVNQHVYNISHDPHVKKAAEDLIAPLEQPGIESVDFKSEGTEPIKIQKGEARDILSSCRTPDDERVDGVETIEAVLRVYAPVYDEKAETWRFDLHGDHIYVDISATTIASDAMQRGGALIGDSYKVILTITEYTTPTGQTRRRHKIEKVLEFKSSPQQTGLF